VSTSQAGTSLRIAGSSSAVPRPGRANSGYLVTSRATKIALDYGTGVFSRMREWVEPTELNAVVVSHMHADHFFDIVPLRYALRYEMSRGEPLPVYLPPGGIAIAKIIGRPLREEVEFYENVLDLREYEPREPLHIGDLTLHFARTVHYVPAFAMRVESASGVLGYSADTAPCDEVARLVQGCDVFLCEAALGAKGTEAGQRGHLNAGEAGEMAERAGAGHLVLTHYGAKARAEKLRAAAEKTFGGRITVADDGMEFPVSTSQAPIRTSASG
jgi:ribonuclease BN (tRNA processing enzyme)